MKFLTAILSFFVIKTIKASTLNNQLFLVNPAIISDSNELSFSITSLGIKPLEDLTAIPNYSNSLKPIWELYLTKSTKDFWEQRNIGVGFWTSSPLGNIQNSRLFSPDEVYFLRYYNSDSVFRFSVLGGLELIPQKVFLGLGTSLYFLSSGTTSVLISSNPQGELALNTLIANSFSGGIIYKSHPFVFGLSYIDEIDSKLSQTVQSSINLSGSELETYPLHFEGSIFYEPAKFIFLFEYFFKHFRLGSAIFYEFWKDYKSRFLKAEFLENNDNIYNTKIPSLAFNNVLSLSILYNIPLINNKLSLFGHYSYKPTPISKNEMNVIDSDSHVFCLGFENYLMNYLRLRFLGELNIISKRHFYKISDKYLWDFNFGGLAYKLGFSVLVTL